MTNNAWNADFYQNKHNFVTSYGEEVVDLLAPKTDELILDLGCGTGELSAKIAQSGAKVFGVDFSQEMVNKAKINYPQLNFLQHNAECAMPFQFKSDAVFSNAALHWMLNADAVVKNLANIIKPEGRFVFEMGGIGNVANLLRAIELASSDFKITDLTVQNYYPSIGEYSSILEANGFLVKYAILFERPTKLDGQDGVRNWVRMFRNSVLNKVDPLKEDEFLKLVETYATPDLYKDNTWFADYVRLRMVAIKH